MNDLTWVQGGTVYLVQVINRCHGAACAILLGNAPQRIAFVDNNCQATIVAVVLAVSVVLPRDDSDKRRETYDEKYCLDRHPQVSELQYDFVNCTND